MTKFSPLKPLQDDLPPEGWVGDPNEWPILFFRNKLKRQYYTPKEDWEKGWICQTTPHTVLCYVCLEDGGWEDLSWELLSALPDLGRRDNQMTWLEYETQLGDPDTFWATVREALGGQRQWAYRENASETPNVDWALQNGICPDQWFILKLTPDYITWPATPDGPEEHDFEVAAELLDFESLAPTEHTRRWHRFLYETPLDDGLPRYKPESHSVLVAHKAKKAQHKI